MTLARMAAVDVVADTLERDSIPTLDRLLLEHSPELRPSQVQDLRQAIGILEEVWSELNSEGE